MGTSCVGCSRNGGSGDTRYRGHHLRVVVALGTLPELSQDTGGTPGPPRAPHPLPPQQAAPHGVPILGHVPILTAARHLHTTPACLKTRAARVRVGKGDKPVTYEKAHPPHYIAHRKGWLSLHTGESPSHRGTLGSHGWRGGGGGHTGTSNHVALFPRRKPGRGVRGGGEDGGGRFPAQILPRHLPRLPGRRGGAEAARQRAGGLPAAAAPPGPRQALLPGGLRRDPPVPPLQVPRPPRGADGARQGGLQVAVGPARGDRGGWGWGR
uniref:Mitochondrial ribosomal protein S24 n=1 Tax=Anas zonorhyncha TaxID=75864 RepID=A0A8C0A1S0_9AVES